MRVIKKLGGPGRGQTIERGGLRKSGVGDGRQHNIGPHADRLAKAKVAADVVAVRRGMAAGGKRGGATVIAGPNTRRGK